ncbi:MAG TPA: ABC transporter permease [Streptosporangiaceae bacterium]
MHALSKSTAVEAKLFLREPLTVAFTLALPLLFLFVMGGVFGNDADPQYYRGAGALDYYVPAYCGLVWTAVGLLALPVHLAHYREDGVLRRLRASAARPWVVLSAQLLVTFLISLVGSVLMILMAALVYDIHAPHSPAGFFGAWLLCGVLFSALGMLLAGIPSSRGVLSAGLGLFFTMMMLSGAGPPPEVLTGAMHWVSNLLPLTYILRLLQDPWLDLSWSLTDTAVVAAFILGATVSARLLFRWD